MCLCPYYSEFGGKPERLHGRNHRFVMTTVSSSYENEKRMLHYYLQLHFCERKVSIIWGHSFNSAGGEWKKTVILCCCVYYLNIEVYYHHIVCDHMTL